MAVQGFEEGENSSCRALAWTSYGITSAIFFWPAQIRAIPESREGNLTTPCLGVVAKPLCKRAHSMPSWEIIGTRKKETLYGRTGDMGKSHQIRRLRIPECVLSIRDLPGVHVDS